MSELDATGWEAEQRLREAEKRNPHDHTEAFYRPPTWPLENLPQERPLTGAAKVLAQQEDHAARIAVLEDHLRQLHNIVHHQAERLNRLDPPTHPGQ